VARELRGGLAGAGPAEFRGQPVPASPVAIPVAIFRPWPRSPRPPQTHTWAISRIKGTPAVEIGWVDAPDAETAIKEAIQRYGITDREQQKRLAARRVN
jgi:hypothetical protein